MEVRIDQPGEHGGVGEVECFRAALGVVFRAAQRSDECEAPVPYDKRFGVYEARVNRVDGGIGYDEVGSACAQRRAARQCVGTQKAGGGSDESAAVHGVLGSTGWPAGLDSARPWFDRLTMTQLEAPPLHKRHDGVSGELYYYVDNCLTSATMAVIMRAKQRLSATERLKNDALWALRIHLVVYRAGARLSQIQLADRAGVSRPVISKMEQGLTSPSFESLAKIAEVLECTIADLFEPIRNEPVSDEEILRRASAEPSDFIDVDFLLGAIEEARQGSPGVARYSARGRKPAVAHHRKARRR